LSTNNHGTVHMNRVGQNHIYVRCIYTFLANLNYKHKLLCTNIDPNLGLARTIYINIYIYIYIYIYGVYTVFLAGTSPNVQSNSVYIYGSGQPYI